MKIAWIGLGNMGLPMASNLHTAATRDGHEFLAHDIDERSRSAAARRGLPVNGEPECTAEGADVVITMLPNGAIVREALAPVWERMSPNGLVIDCSTIAGADALILLEEARSRGRRFLDAPVSGGTVKATDGTLTFMVGADEDDLAEARPLIEAMAGRIFHAGVVGRGQHAKILNNLMAAINMQSVVEAARLAEALGFDHRALVDIATASSGDSWVLRSYYPVAGVTPGAPAERDFEGGFATSLMLKDVTLALQTATEEGVQLPAAEDMRGRLRERVDAGLGAKDFSILVRELSDSALAGAR